MGVKAHTGWLRTYSNEFFAPRTFSTLILTTDGRSYSEYVENEFEAVKEQLKNKPGLITRTSGNYNEYTNMFEISGDIFNDFRTRPTSANWNLDEKTLAELLSDDAGLIGNVARAEFSHAEGYGTSAMNIAAHAEGKWTEARDKATHAEGLGTIAQRIGSHAEGLGTKAGMDNDEANDGYGAHAEGINTYANGRAAHAEGENTIAHRRAHAEGYNTQALEEYSHAEGEGTIAYLPGQHVQGKYNAPAANAVHIIGGGSSDANRSNLHTVDINGNSWYKGNITAGGDMNVNTRLYGTANTTGRNTGMFGTALPTTNLSEGQIFFLIIEED